MNDENQKIPPPDIISLINDSIFLIQKLRQENFVRKIDLLTFEKKLLLMKLILLKCSREGVGHILNQPTFRVRKKLSRNEQKVLSFINSRPKIDNLSVFYRFPEVSKRTLRRCIKELLAGGLIRVVSIDRRKIIYSAATSD